MFSNIKAVIFDMDGTLVDSMWLWREVDIEYLERRRNIAIPDDLQSCIEGMKFSETAEYFKSRFNLPDSIEAIMNDWNNLAKEIYATRVPLKEGIYDFLQRLYDKGYKLAIATCNSTELTSTVLKALKIDRFFNHIVTASEVSKGKPAPDIYLEAASRCDILPENCLVFEDIPNGIMAGKNAGMKVCAVEDNFSLPMTDEKIRLSDYYIKSYNDLMRA